MNDKLGHYSFSVISNVTVKEEAIFEELKSLLEENKAILAPSKSSVDEIMLILGPDDEENNAQVCLSLKTF
jgi:division protein CdvB (Snf7/Vps24/ESCRT-III family)